MKNCIFDLTPSEKEWWINKLNYFRFTKELENNFWWGIVRHNFCMCLLLECFSMWPGLYPIFMNLVRLLLIIGEGNNVTRINIVSRSLSRFRATSFLMDSSDFLFNTVARCKIVGWTITFETTLLQSILRTCFCIAILKTTLQFWK